LIFSVRAPGRVNLIGEHTDYSGGLALPVAIEQGVTLKVDALGPEIALESEGFAAEPAFAADGRGGPLEGWARYAHGVAAELAQVGRPAVGIRGSVSSTLAVGAGLGSSGAFSVAVALALCAAAAWEAEPATLVEVCRRAEQRAAGVPCGVLDQAASLLGRRGSAVLLDCGTLEHRHVPLPPELGLVVLDSGTRRRHETSAYADRRRELEAGMPARVRHVRSESDRVLGFVAALERNDLAEAGAQLLRSHASLRDDYEVSTPELDLLVELACDAGAYGARLVGGGFGGSVLALTHADNAELLAADVARAYRARGFVAADPLRVRACAGASVHR